MIELSSVPTGELQAELKRRRDADTPPGFESDERMVALTLWSLRRTRQRLCESRSPLANDGVIVCDVAMARITHLAGLLGMVIKDAGDAEAT